MKIRRSHFTHYKVGSAPTEDRVNLKNWGEVRAISLWWWRVARSELPGRPCQCFVGSTAPPVPHSARLRKTINLLSNSKLLALLLLLSNGSAGNKTLENSDKFYSFVMSRVLDCHVSGGPGQLQTWEGPIHYQDHGGDGGGGSHLQNLKIELSNQINNIMAFTFHGS